jgi:hypothetical protein
MCHDLRWAVRLCPKQETVRVGAKMTQALRSRPNHSQNEPSAPRPPSPSRAYRLAVALSYSVCYSIHIVYTVPHESYTVQRLNRLLKQRPLSISRLCTTTHSQTLSTVGVTDTVQVFPADSRLSVNAQSEIAGTDVSAPGLHRMS